MDRGPDAVDDHYRVTVGDDMADCAPAAARCITCELPITASRGGSPRRYCSPACRQAAYRRRHGDRSARPTRCAGCYSPIDQPRGRGRPRRFCSGACEAAARRHRRQGLPEDWTG